MDGGDSEGDPRVRSVPRAEGAGLYRGGERTATRRRGARIYFAAVAPYLKDR